MIARLTKSLLILLMLVPIVRPQSIQQPATAVEEKKIQEERNRKALVLIEIQELSDCLGSIAVGDFDHARLLGGLFQRREIRVIALLQIVQSVLDSDE